MTRPKGPHGWHHLQVPRVYDLIHTCGHYGSTVNRARDPGKAVGAQREKAQPCFPCRMGRPQDARTTRNELIELV